LHSYRPESRSLLVSRAPIGEIADEAACGRPPFCAVTEG
jgi:hypothetical protein